MLIGIDASRANRTHKSGTEWYSYHMIRALAAADTDNQYILYTDSPLSGGLLDLRPDGENSGYSASVNEQGWQKMRSPHNNFKAKVLDWPFKFFWTQGRLSLEMLIKSPDILFVPAHALPLLHPRNSVVTIHDIGFRHDPALYEKNRLGADGRRSHTVINFFVRLLTLGKYGANTFDYLEWSTKFSVRHSRRVIAISAFTKQALQEAYHVPEERMTVIYNGYASELYHLIPDTEASQSVLDRYGLSEPYIFYVGRLEKKKNTTTLIEAFSRLKQKQGATFKHTLCLVGDASYGFDEIKYTIQEYDLANDIIITGWVAEEDLPHIFARAAAFVFPSNYEGFGIPLLQAMATGTPIVASRVASIPEVVGEAGLLCDPKDSQSVAEALEKVLFDHELRQRLIQAGTERVKQFSWQKAATELLAVFARLKQKS